MSHRVGTLIVLACLVMAPALSGCLTTPQDERSGRGADEVRDAKADSNPAPEPQGVVDEANGSADQSSPLDNHTVGDEPTWDERHATWTSCFRSGGPLPRCPHAHPETVAPHAHDVPRLLMRHHVNATSWTAIPIRALAQVSWQDLRVDWSAPTGTTTLQDIVVTNGTATYYLQDGLGAWCADCGEGRPPLAAPFPVEETGFRLVFHDRDDDGLVTPSDSLTITYDDDNATNTFGATFPDGRFALDFDSIVQGNYRATADLWNLYIETRSIGDGRTPWWNATTLADLGPASENASDIGIQVPGYSIRVVPKENGTTTQTWFAHHLPGNDAIACDTHAACGEPEPPATGPAFRIRLVQADAEPAWTAGDHILVDFDDGERADRTWTSPLPTGRYTLTIAVGPHDSAFTGTTGSVHDGRTP